MDAEVFEWEIYGYFRFPVVAKLTVTNKLTGVIQTIFEYAEWRNEAIKAIKILKNKKTMLHIERYKDKWIKYV